MKANTSSKLLVASLLGLILVQLLFASALLLRHDLFFHTDIARDFLLFEDMYETKKPTLIGPRSGGIPGVFHGPMWIYLNMIPFVIGKGNPLVMGWFWLLLCIVSLGIFYWVARKITDQTTALLGTLLYASTLPPYANNLFNPYGAVMLAPIMLYFWYRYHLSRSLRYLAGLILTLGLMVQFQMAFSGPALVLLIVYLCYAYRLKVPLKHWMAFGLLLLPLSTFLFFDVRHNFLQIRSVINYLTHPDTSGINWAHFFQNRFFGILRDGWSVLPYNLGYLVVPFMVYAQTKINKGSSRDNRASIIGIFLFIYIGYWIVTLLFRGEIWSFYTLPFQPLTILALLALVIVLPKKIVYGLLSLFITINVINNIRHVHSLDEFSGKNVSSWKFNYTVAQQIMAYGDNTPGYFVYSPDQYGYSMKYALLYLGKHHPEIRLSSFVKRDTTYLFIAADDPKNPYTNSGYWKKMKLGIDKQPAREVTYDNGYVVQQYRLTKDEQSVPIDPNLITDLHFR